MDPSHGTPLLSLHLRPVLADEPPRILALRMIAFSYGPRQPTSHSPQYSILALAAHLFFFFLMDSRRNCAARPLPASPDHPAGLTAAFALEWLVYSRTLFLMVELCDLHHQTKSYVLGK